jgi:hypothetical protein
VDATQHIQAAGLRALRSRHANREFRLVAPRFARAERMSEVRIGPDRVWVASYLTDELLGFAR